MNGANGPLKRVCIIGMVLGLGAACHGARRRAGLTADRGGSAQGLGQEHARGDVPGPSPLAWLASRRRASALAIRLGRPGIKAAGRVLLVQGAGTPPKGCPPAPMGAREREGAAY